MSAATIAPLLLVLSIALSRNGLVAVFAGSSPARNVVAPLPMLACAVCITSLGLALSNVTLSIGMMVVVTGFLAGQFVRGMNMPFAALLSFAFLLAYVRCGVAAF